MRIHQFRIWSSGFDLPEPEIRFCGTIEEATIKIRTLYEEAGRPPFCRVYANYGANQLRYPMRTK